MATDEFLEHRLRDGLRAQLDGATNPYPTWVGSPAQRRVTVSSTRGRQAGRTGLLLLAAVLFSLVAGSIYLGTQRPDRVAPTLLAVVPSVVSTLPTPAAGTPLPSTGARSPAAPSPTSADASPSAPAIPSPSSEAPSDPPTSLAPAAWSAIRWSAPTSFSGDFSARDLAATSLGYVMVGQPNENVGEIWYSPDLASWTRALTVGSSTAPASIDHVLATPTGFVAFGWSYPHPCGGPIAPDCPVRTIRVWTSPDGHAWHRVQASAMSRGTIRDVYASGSEFLAVGDVGWNTPAIWESSDGTSWRRVSPPGEVFRDAHLYAVTAAPSGWVVVGILGGHELQCCADDWRPGETRLAAWNQNEHGWSRADVPSDPAEWDASLQSVFAGRSGTIALDEGALLGDTKPAPSADSRNLLVTTDGLQWQTRTIQWDTDPRPVADDGAVILGIRTDKRVATSTDGVGWRDLASLGRAETLVAADPLNLAVPFLVRFVPGGVVLVDHAEPDGRLAFWVGTGVGQ